MAKLPIGIDKAKFDKEMEEWVFQDKKPFWKDFRCDAERLARPSSPKTRAPLNERKEIAMVERAAADLAGRLEKTIAARSPEDAERKRRLEEASSQALKDAKSDKERKQIQVGADMMNRLAGARNLEALLAEMNRAMGGPALNDIFDDDDEERDECGPSSGGWFEVSLLEGRKKGIDAAQRKAYEDYANNHATIGASVLKAIFAYYQKSRESYAEAFGEKSVPVISRPEELKFLIEHQAVLVHPPSKDGNWAGCEIGLTFACEWEDEHGLGVRLRGNKVVEVGHADVAHGAQDDESGDSDEA